MSKKAIVLVSLLAALAIVICVCVMSFAPETPSDDTDETTGAPNKPDTSLTEPTKGDEKPNKPSGPNGPGGQLGDGVSWLKHTEKMVYSSSAYGVVYREQGKYGILSLDGKKDSGAIYYNFDVLRKYFTVVTRKPSEPSNLNDINATGLVDGEGNVLIPPEYALIKSFASDRYFQVFKATEITENKDEYLIYLTSSMFSLAPSDGDVLYKGNWYVYDIEAGKTVDGVSASKNYGCGVNGDMIYYYNDDHKYISVNTQGKPYPQNAAVMDNGSYYMKNEGVVYDAFGQKLFSCADEKYDSIYYYHGYYLCAIYQVQEKTLRILDETGRVVSVDFDDYVSVFGKDMLLVGKTAYDFQGNKHVNADISSISQYGDIWYLSNYETKDYYLFSRNQQ